MLTKLYIFFIVVVVFFKAPLCCARFSFTFLANRFMEKTAETISKNVSEYEWMYVCMSECICICIFIKPPPPAFSFRHSFHMCIYV